MHHERGTRRQPKRCKRLEEKASEEEILEMDQETLQSPVGQKEDRGLASLAPHRNHMAGPWRYITLFMLG